MVASPGPKTAGYHPRAGASRERQRADGPRPILARLDPPGRPAPLRPASRRLRRTRPLSGPVRPRICHTANASRSARSNCGGSTERAHEADGGGEADGRFRADAASADVVSQAVQRVIQHPKHLPGSPRLPRPPEPRGRVGEADVGAAEGQPRDAQQVDAAINSGNPEAVVKAANTFIVEHGKIVVQLAERGLINPDQAARAVLFPGAGSDGSRLQARRWSRRSTRRAALDGGDRREHAQARRSASGFLFSAPSIARRGRVRTSRASSPSERASTASRDPGPRRSPAPTTVPTGR